MISRFYSAEVGDEVRVSFGGSILRCRVMAKFSCGGGWVRPFRPTGELDERRESVVSIDRDDRIE